MTETTDSPRAQDGSDQRVPATDRMADHAGAVIVTSTKPDLYRAVTS